MPPDLTDRQRDALAELPQSGYTSWARVTGEPVPRLSTIAAKLSRKEGIVIRNVDGAIQNTGSFSLSTGPSHACRVCQSGKEIATPRSRYDDWCDECGAVRTFATQDA